MVQVAGGNMGQVLGGVDELGSQVEGQRHRGAIIFGSQFTSSGLAWPLPRTAAAGPGRFDRLVGGHRGPSWLGQWPRLIGMR